MSCDVKSEAAKSLGQAKQTGCGVARSDQDLADCEPVSDSRPIDFRLG
jgi:hypothetical protein